MSDQKVVYELSLKDLLTNKVKEAEGAVNKFEGTIGSAQRRLGEFAAAFGVAFGVAAVTAFGSRMVEAGSKVENALTGLTTLLKDKAEAQQVINNTMDDATRTPFAFEGLLAANKALISAGVSADQARTDVLNLANAIAATGGGDDELQRMVINMQQIKNTGKATAADIKQFAFAGVNIYKILADATNQPIEKIKDMEVSYDMLTYALQKAHDEGGIYAGGLENMAKNTSVQISNLGDSVFQLSVKMFNDLKPAIDGLISGLATAVGWLRTAWDWMVKNKDVLAAVTITVGVATAAYQIYLFTMGEGIIATGLLTAAQWALNVAMTANPIGLLIAALAALVGGLVYAWNHFAKFRAVLMGVWETIKEWGRLVIDIFTGVWQVIKGVFTMDADMIKLGSKKQLDAMFNAGQRLGSAFKKGYEGGLASFEASKAEGTPATVNAPAPPKKTTATKPTIEPKAQTKSAQGSKAVTINISIGNLIKDFQVKTTNITEGSSKVREMVTQAILAATNDSQIIAGA